jgi:hypothetical protein
MSWAMRLSSGATIQTPFSLQQAADDVGVGALGDFDDRALGTAAAVGAGDARQHAVAMQDFLHFLIGQEQVVARLVRDHEAEAVAVRADAAGDEARVVGQCILAGGIRADLAVALHRIQAAREHALRFRIDLQGTCQCAAVERPLGIAENAEDLLAARNGMSWLLQIVFLCC